MTAPSNNITPTNVVPNTTPLADSRDCRNVGAGAALGASSAAKMANGARVKLLQADIIAKCQAVVNEWKGDEECYACCRGTVIASICASSGHQSHPRIYSWYVTKGACEANDAEDKKGSVMRATYPEDQTPSEEIENRADGTWWTNGGGIEAELAFYPVKKTLIIPR